MTKFTKKVAAFVFLAGASVPSAAFAACTVPNALSNGQVADASKVMDDINAVASCVDATTNSAVTTTGAPATGAIAVISGPKSVTSGNLSGDVSTSGGTVTALAPTGVIPGIYTNATIGVDEKGRVTSAANGTGGGGTGGGVNLNNFFNPPPMFALFPSFNGVAALIPSSVTSTTNFNVVPSSTNTFTRIPRYGIGGSLGAGGFAQIRGQGSFYLVPSVVTVGIGFENVPAGARILAGYQNGWSGGTDISAGSYILGLAKDAGDSNMQIIARNNGAVTKIDLGPSFPGNGSGFGYVAKFSIKPDGTVDYQVTHLLTGATASGNISTNLPAMTVVMYGGAWFAAATAQTVQGSLVGYTVVPTF